MDAISEVAEAVKNLPALRFPEFDGEWKEGELRDLANIYDGTHQTPTYVAKGVKFVSVENIGDINKASKFITKEAFEKNFKVKPKKGDVLMTRITAGVIGATAIIQDNNPLGYYVSLALIRKKGSLNEYFLSHLINSFQFKRELHKRIIHVAFPKKINLGDIGHCKSPIPSLPEQQKIASFLTAVDDKIQQLSRKKELLEQYKKGVMQEIFSQQIRFKDDKGNDFPEWEEKKLGQVFGRVKTKNAEDNKNVLTISAQHGLINQEDFFNKSVSAENVTGYYLLHKGNFAYNKSYSKGYPMGAIKRLNKYDKGVVSTLYICFKIKDGSSEEYYEQYFASGSLNRELHKIAQEGARNHGLLNMSVVEFFDDNKIPRPSKAEQIKIANFLVSVDNKVDLATKQLEQARQFKKGLLQQLFV